MLLQEPDDELDMTDQARIARILTMPKSQDPEPKIILSRDENKLRLRLNLFCNRFKLYLKIIA